MRLRSSQWVAAPLEEVFHFFSRAENLETITPSSLGFSMRTPPPETMRDGLLLDYDLKVHGIPLRWTSLITGWTPPYAFTDVQVRGPYRCWVHLHRFTEENGGTRVEDEVTYKAPGGRWVEPWAVRPDLKRIFTHRQRVIAERFGA